MPSMGEEGKKGGVLWWEKGTPRREETKESRRKGGVPFKGKSAARIEEKFMEDIEEESWVVL